MADGQYGGNESVHWIVNADDASAVTNGQHPKGAKWRQSGVDYHKNPNLGKDFIVRVKLPADSAKRTAFLNALLAEVNRAVQDARTQQIEFRIEIETGAVARTQIQVSWGKPTPWYEGLQEVHPSADAKKQKVADIGGTGTAV
jgi:hypothetical protein